MWVSANCATASDFWSSWEDFNKKLLGYTFYVNCYFEGDKSWPPRSFKISKNAFGRKKFHELEEDNWILLESVFKDTAITTKRMTELTIDNLRHPELEKRNAFWVAREKFLNSCKGKEGDILRKHGITFTDTIFENVDDSCQHQTLEDIFEVRGYKTISQTLSFIRGTLTKTYEPNKYSILINKKCESPKPWRCARETSNSSETNNIDFSHRANNNLPDYSEYGQVVAETGNLQRQNLYYECEKVR